MSASERTGQSKLDKNSSDEGLGDSTVDQIKELTSSADRRRSGCEKKGAAEAAMDNL